MDLTGKKINFLGDSITEGVGASCEENAYVALLKRKYALGEARNYGIGGTRIAQQRQPSEEPRWDLDFCGRVEQMDPDAEIVVVFGGTNDYGHGDAPLGGGDDRTPESFRGACRTLWQSLRERFPQAETVVLTPLHRAGEELPRASGFPLAAYAEVLRETAAEYGFPVCDLFAHTAIRANDPEIAARCAPDGLHPNDVGHALLADEIGQYLQTL